jgi:hypothetical protein
VDGFSRRVLSHAYQLAGAAQFSKTLPLGKQETELFAIHRRFLSETLDHAPPLMPSGPWVGAWRGEIMP